MKNGRNFRSFFSFLKIKTIGTRVAFYKVMACDDHQSEIDEIAREILSYLADHPDAQDTLEGIVQWWLLERKIKCQTALVKEALEELVAKGLILEHRRANAKSLYGIHPRKQRTGQDREQKR